MKVGDVVYHDFMKGKVGKMDGDVVTSFETDFGSYGGNLECFHDDPSIEEISTQFRLRYDRLIAVTRNFCGANIHGYFARQWILACTYKDDKATVDIVLSWVDEFIIRATEAADTTVFGVKLFKWK